ncbi:anthranilate synthase component II [Chryseobacterium sp.]|uniref:anthranilate synthase component II n=1 Tax=Chryseobacterium sp. TaxID=1871047 RepID=UPI0012AA67A9|nr:aminodeoxychorismate/anthranilate synthase component II [Chryseobacterium sp.]QFG52874.1 aminodeoxychorismate/anthranilate synthase component II [Chryseobacterium sp.]
MKILILDNYDSFTYNLVQMTEQILGERVQVAKNDEISVAQAAQFDKIILSPGPGIPSEAGILKELIRDLHQEIPMLGICLGLQAIAETFGGKLINLHQIYHGVASPVIILNTECKLFQSIPQNFEAGRYHSWAVHPDTFPEPLEVTAVDADGIIMALQHRSYNLHAVQFHPESVLTTEGKKIISNFLLD